MRAALALLAALALAACASASRYDTPANYPDIVGASLHECAYIPAPDAVREIIAKSGDKTSGMVADDICRVIRGKGPPNVAGVPLQGFKVK